MYHNDRKLYLSKDDERPPSEAGPPPPTTQKPQEQASLRTMLRASAPKEKTVTQNQKDEVPLALRGVLVG